MRVASNDLVIIEQSAEIAVEFSKIDNDPLVPGCYHRNKLFEEKKVLVYKAKKVTKVVPTNGQLPIGRFCHQSVMIGTEEGQTPYLVSYAGLNSQR